MKKKNVQEMNFNAGQDSENKLSVHEKGLPIIRCICGSEILLIPDLEAMSTAVKTHLSEHKKKTEDSDSLKWLEQFLTEQVLIVATEVNLPTAN